MFSKFVQPAPTAMLLNWKVQTQLVLAFSSSVKHKYRIHLIRSLRELFYTLGVNFVVNTLRKNMRIVSFWRRHVGSIVYSVIHTCTHVLRSGPHLQLLTFFNAWKRIFEKQNFLSRPKVFCLNICLLNRARADSF